MLDAAVGVATAGIAAPTAVVEAPAAGVDAPTSGVNMPAPTVDGPTAAVNVVTGAFGAPTAGMDAVTAAVGARTAGIDAVTGAVGVSTAGARARTAAADRPTAEVDAFVAGVRSSLHDPLSAIRAISCLVAGCVPGHPAICPGQGVDGASASDFHGFVEGTRAAQAAGQMPGASLRNVTAASSPRAPMTVDEWAALEEDVPGELVDGVLVEEEMPSAIHERVIWWLMKTLSAWLEPRGGMIFGSGLKLAVRPRSGRMPDLNVYLVGRKPEPRGAVRVPPHIVIEIVSPEPRDERRDRVEKPDDYAAFGVRWYWLVDPELRSFEIWELGADGRYVRACGAIGGKIDPVPGCDGLALDVDALWAEVDALVA